MERNTAVKTYSTILVAGTNLTGYLPIDSHAFVNDQFDEAMHVTDKFGILICETGGHIEATQKWADKRGRTYGRILKFINMGQDQEDASMQAMTSHGPVRDAFAAADARGSAPEAPEYVTEGGDKAISDHYAALSKIATRPGMLVDFA